MSITTLLDPTLLPARTMDQSAFDAAMAYLMTNLPAWGGQANTLAANLNSIAYGGAYALSYKWGVSSNASVGYSAGGFIALNDGVNGSIQAAPASAVYIFLDTKDQSTASVAALLNSTVSGNNSAVKGHIRLVKQGDASKWARFSVTGYAQNGGGLYGVFNITFIDSSSATPFATNDTVMLSFQRTGDKGDIGVASFPSMHVREEQSAGTAAAAGTTISSTEYRRVLNTVKSNDISGASLSSNQVTLTVAGKYLMRARSNLAVSVGSGAVAGQKSAIYDATAGAYVGTSMLGGVIASGTGTVTVPTPVSEAIAIVTTTGTKTFELRTLTSQTVATWGSALNVSVPEVYTELIIEKIG